MQKEMNFEKVAISNLSFDPSNVRKHDEKNIDSIKASLRKFGQQKPIVVDHNNIVIAGNGTMEAAKAIGWTDIYISRSELTNAEAVAYAISDNRTAELAQWDKEPLGAHLQGLQEDGWDLEELGFQVDDIKELDLFDQPDGGPVEGEDDVPEVAENIHNVKLGQIYQLGEHRLMCGDSTDKETVEKLMNGEKADMVFTDPPYEYISTNRGGGCLGDAARKAGKKKEHLSSFDPKEFLEVLPLYMGDRFAAYIFSNVVLVPDYMLWARETKRSYNLLTWHKTSFIPVNKNHHFPDTEYCTFIGKKPIWNMGLDAECYRKYWIAMREENKIHPTMKPVEIIVNCIKVNSLDSVADPFLGSGSTLIACEKTNRKCFGMELSEHYCSVIIERWQQFTDKKAILL